MSALVNSVLRLVKWPVALASVATLPGAVLAFRDEIEAVVDAFEAVSPFLYGAGGYFVLWRLVLRRRWMREGTFWATFEHELTHTVFSLLTFNPLREFMATGKRGGYMSHGGDENWLIPISPYFFPTLSVPVMLIMLVLEGDEIDVANVVLGVTVAYHITSTYRETRLTYSQKGVHPLGDEVGNDFRGVGIRFVWCFLPAANIVSYGMILGMARDNLDGLKGYLTSLWDHSYDFWREVGALVGSMT